MADGEGVVAPGNYRGQSSVTSERWKEVDALFEQALVAPADERSRFLQAIENDELRHEIESLLEAHADAFLDEPERFFSSESMDSFAADEIIDRYRIIREIGRGGMGAVFLAERADDEYQKQVAIKLIKRGTDTDSVLRHFRSERQILAGFDHPNIARLFDGGTTESGLPYFVMEYVEGLPIDEYCNTRALSVIERLQLFREVCAAVSYAHRRLVVHRDIKRSNILITAEGVPKLLDFGIAKILHEDDEPLATRTGLRLMTPEYASPEQVRGEPVTTASDVYSLGVVLYELLTGQSPYGSTTPHSNDFARVINEIQPKRPSTVISRIGSQKPEIKNQKILRGDLDNIVLMALRKEPERRYQSVEQFSEDIRRHLQDLPVLAQKDTVGYRASKFARRNKTALAAAALVLLILVGGIIATSREAQIANREKARAERRFNEVRKLANSVLFDYHDAIKSLPGATKVRERLVKDALNYLDSLASEAHGDPALQRELAAAYARVGDVRGGESSGSLGDVAGAVESYTKALKIQEALVAENPGDTQTRRDLASSHQKIGYLLLETEEASNGLEHLRKALALYLDLTREQPADDNLQLELATTREQFGAAMEESQTDLGSALEQCHAALAICEKLVASNPQDQRYRRALWFAQDRIGYALFLQHNITGAIEAKRKALALGEALIAADPLNADYRRRLVVSYQQGGDFRKESDKPGALECFRKAAALDEELLVADPGNALTRKDLAYTHKRIADFLTELEDNSQALLHFSKALESYEKVVEDAPADLVSRFLVATCHAGVARMKARLGEIDPALKECRETIALLQGITEDKTGGFGLGRAQAYEYLGYAYAALAASPKESRAEARQRMATARDMFRQALNILEELRSRRALGGNEPWMKEIAGEIAECDTTLGK